VTTLLDVLALSVWVRHPGGGRTTVVDRVAFSVAPGECVAVVGESGSGKSLTALSLLNLLPQGAHLEQGTRITMGQTGLHELSAAELRQWRGGRIAMVFQDHASSLNPVLRIGSQVVEALRAHRDLPRRAARAQAIDLLREVGIADPDERFTCWPHELSGGMRQRVMLAIALAGEPELLVADEPTTALDVTVQAQILELLDALRASRRMAVLLITHDLGIVAQHADRVLVMYAGRIVESGDTAALFDAPRHFYTQGLLASRPRLGGGLDRPTGMPGAIPAPAQWPSGCRFHPRCPAAVPRCAAEAPPMLPFDARHQAACWVAHAGETP
jgi:oligopeptide/dipeptide ABC transporter ATP-binding protein